jgi:aminoglycoside phosphotransferase
LLVLQALPGTTLRDVIRTGGDRVPSAGSILAMLDRLPPGIATGRRRRSWLDRVEHYAAVVATITPVHATRVTELAKAIRAEAGVGPTVAVHGDLYESQLLVSDGVLTGVLDIDGAGPGDRLDDLACLLGHLSVLATVDLRRAPLINRIGADYLGTFERSVDPADLRYRTAAVVVSLIAGPHRVQDPHWPATTARLIDLAERWLASARRVARHREKTLIAGSSPSHGRRPHSSNQPLSTRSTS